MGRLVGLLLGCVVSVVGLTTVPCGAGQTCTCPNNDRCEILCTNCQGSTLVCHDWYPCDITCDAANACQDATASGNIGVVVCKGDFSCRHMTVDCHECEVDCDGSEAC
eukprot:Hpha_TRINITY_DN29012_c0_g1::TRINITY_DN29012_c0_g1_i1::g.156485::m.156485